MWKRIILGTLLVAVVGVLIVGAVNRTMAKAGGDVGEGNGYRRGQVQLHSQQVVPLSERQGRGRGGWGDTEPLGDRSGTGQAVVGEWVTVRGTVAAMDRGSLVVKIADGATVEIENRAWLFAQDQGFTAHVGDQVIVVGFYENGDLEARYISNETNGQTVYLRDESGRPLWAGQGRGNR